MKTLSYLIPIFFLSTLCFAQKSDSIEYKYGYLYYHEFGSNQNPPVIVLTGGPGNSYKQLEEMSIRIGEKYRSIIPEQRGTGKSIPKPFNEKTINANALTDDLNLLMEHLNLEKATIVGHSWGGMLAMNFAALYPERIQHLILIAPGPHKDVENGFSILGANSNHTRSDSEQKRMGELSKLIEKEEADSLEVVEYMKLFRRAYVYENPISDELFIKLSSYNNAKTQDLLLKDIFKNFDVSKSLSNYVGKVDIVAGRQDVVGVFSYELKFDRPDATLYWMNECGHFPMYEKPEEFYDLLFKLMD